MSDMLLPVSVYLIDSVLSGIYMHGFLKEKYRKKAVLAAWSAVYFLIQIAVFEILDSRFSVAEVTGIILNVCILLFLQFFSLRKIYKNRLLLHLVLWQGKKQWNISLLCSVLR